MVAPPTVTPVAWRTGASTPVSRAGSVEPRTGGRAQPAVGERRRGGPDLDGVGAGVAYWVAAVGGTTVELNCLTYVHPADRQRAGGRAAQRDGRRGRGRAAVHDGRSERVVHLGAVHRAQGGGALCGRERNVHDAHAEHVELQVGGHLRGRGGRADGAVRHLGELTDDEAQRRRRHTSDAERGLDVDRVGAVGHLGLRREELQHVEVGGHPGHRDVPAPAGRAVDREELAQLDRRAPEVERLQRGVRVAWRRDGRGAAVQSAPSGCSSRS